MCTLALLGVYACVHLHYWLCMHVYTCITGCVYMCTLALLVVYACVHLHYWLCMHVYTCITGCVCMCTLALLVVYACVHLHYWLCMHVYTCITGCVYMCTHIRSSLIYVHPHNAGLCDSSQELRCCGCRGLPQQHGFVLVGKQHSSVF